MVQSIQNSSTSARSSLGILPPWAQIEKEKNTILNDPRLAEILGDKKVISLAEFAIHDNGDKEYHVQVEGGEFVRVMRHYTKQKPYSGWAGPASFEITFGTLETPNNYFTGLRLPLDANRA